MIRSLRFLSAHLLATLACIGAISDVMALTSANARAPGDENRSREHWQALLDQLDQLDQLAPGSEEQARLREMVDVAAGQRFGYASRLYWHTDWERAAEEARQEGKPVLSLRMLGRLTDELSCANSRFFRTALYPNAAVSKMLQEHFVLHWTSERPAPVLTVDFGDGRVMKRTVTGNSIHYLRNPDGEVIDALPGMVSPQTFANWLTASHTRYATGAADTGDLIGELSTAWEAELQRVGRQPGAPPISLTPEVSQAILNYRTAASTQATQVNAAPLRVPRAEAAVALAAPKGLVEAPVVSQLTVSGLPIQSVQSDELWKQLAAQHVDQWRLDEASLKLIRSLQPKSIQGGDEGFEAMIRKFEYSIAQDDLRNRFVMQWKVRQWLANGTTEFEELNRRVYSGLFLTPRDDPYLGLVDSQAFTGLVRSGLSE